WPAATAQAPGRSRRPPDCVAAVRGSVQEPQTMSKSRLSTDDMARLKKAGIKLGMIATLAGITRQGVRCRILPRYRWNPEEYAYEPDPVYQANHPERQREYHHISPLHPRIFASRNPT